MTMFQNSEKKHNGGRPRKHGNDISRTTRWRRKQERLEVKNRVLEQVKKNNEGVKENAKRVT
jgi:hypothetical protein